MRREFSFTHARRTSGRGVLGWVTLIVVVLVGIDVLSGGAIRARTQSASTIVWSAGDAVYTAIFDSGYFLSHRTLARENASLRAQLASNRENSATITALREENTSLRELVQLASSERGITAPVVSSVIASPYGTFLVGAGEADGLKEGSLVLSPGGFVVGTIVHVGEEESMAQEVFAARSELAVTVRATSALAEGRGGGNAKLTIPREILVEVGDVATAPSLGGRPVGIVGQIDAPAAQAQAEVYVSLPVSLSSMPYVFLIP